MVDPGAADGITIGAIATAAGITLGIAAWIRDRFLQDPNTIPDEGHQMTESWRHVALDAINRLDDCEELRDSYRERLSDHENIV